MNLKKEPMVLIQGTSVFVPIKPSISSVRIAVKKALLQEKKQRHFRVCGEIFCDTGSINSHLLQLANHENVFAEHALCMRGAPGRILNCLLLADPAAQEGVVLHRSNRSFICACIPIVSLENAQSDYNLALDLAILAEKSRGTKIHLHRCLHGGEWDFQALLTEIALDLDPLSNKS